MRNWIYVINPFLTASEGSMLVTYKISLYHDNALAEAKADPFILALYNLYHPIHLTLKAEYDACVTQDGLQRGESLNLNQLIRLLAHSKIQGWDIKIQNVYPQSTPQYKKLMPNRRIPFQSGAQVDRIGSVKSLSIAIGNDVALKTLKAEIDSFYTLIDTAHNTQKMSISSTKSHSKAFEHARVAACNAQFSNYGALIQKYYATPEVVTHYFDMKLLRNTQQVLFNGHVKPNEVYTVVKHTFTDTDEIFIDNSGTSPLKIYLAESKDQRPTATAFNVLPGKHTLPIKNLGNIAFTYVCIFNPDANLIGEFEIEII